MPNIEVTLKLEKIDGRKFIELEIEEDCKLRDAVELKLRLKFKRGHSYYQFAHEKENISRDKELIFMNKVNNVKVYYRSAENFHWIFFFQSSYPCTTEI